MNTMERHLPEGWVAAHVITPVTHNSCIVLLEDYAVITTVLDFGRDAVTVQLTMGEAEKLRDFLIAQLGEGEQ